MSLKQFEKNIKSQFGEDGVIQEIFTRIGVANSKCVEFGAWDGIHYSNTWNLWQSKKWEALLIEGDVHKFNVLTANLKGYDNVKAVNAYVLAEGINSLENIMSRSAYPTDVDLLSVDIDGDDYYIFESLVRYKPRVIVIEYNPTIPAVIELIQQKGGYFGSSARSLLKLANSMNYKLAHMTDTNMFFVVNTDFHKLGFDEPNLDDLFDDKYIAYVISSYGGSMFVAGDLPYGELAVKKIKSDHPLLINVNGIKLEKSIIYKL